MLEGRTELLAIRSTLSGVAGVAVSALLRGSAGGSDGAPGYTLHAPRRGRGGMGDVTEGPHILTCDLWQLKGMRFKWVSPTALVSVEGPSSAAPSKEIVVDASPSHLSGTVML